MEDTCFYHENLAYYLFKIKKVLHIVLVNKSKHYLASFNIKTKTDEMDSKVLSKFGVKRKHRPWTLPKDVYLTSRNLTRYHLQLQDQKNNLLNIQHDENELHETKIFILKSNKKLINIIEKQIWNVKRKFRRL